MYLNETIGISDNKTRGCLSVFNKLHFSLSSTSLLHTLSSLDNQTTVSTFNLHVKIQIVLWNLDTMDVLQKFPTLGGFVYKLAVSPINPSMYDICPILCQERVRTVSPFANSQSPNSPNCMYCVCVTYNSANREQKLLLQIQKITLFFKSLYFSCILVVIILDSFDDSHCTLNSLLCPHG